MKLISFKKDVLVKGRRFTVYSIGWFAFLLHRTPWTIRNWERKGILPKPILNLGNDTRWYLPDEIEGYAKIYLRADVRAGKKIEETRFKHEAHVFEAELSKRVNRNDQTLSIKLENDEVIGKALMDRTEVRFIDEIETILGRNENKKKEKSKRQRR
jgi:DNA-binding transcriptional MerR regulator